MIPSWPIIFLMTLWSSYISPLICGPYFLVDTFRYHGVENQVRFLHPVVR